VQIAKLKAVGCDKIFEEKKSGATDAERQQLTDALTYIREGDQLVVTRLDRLARSVRDLSNITKQLEAKQVDLVVLDQKIDTSSPT
jgi:DNA invertase Pin-like site-specific DNA recombinase